MLSNKRIKTLLASLIVVGIIGFQAVNAHATKSGIKKLYHEPLPGVPGKELIVARLTGIPGFATPKHTHPGSFYVYILSGELTIEMNGETSTYQAGEFYPESTDVPMVGKNASATDDLELIVFQVGDTGKPLMVPVE
jgi:quercetin dioxygenase-like cupin family protein